MAAQRVFVKGQIYFFRRGFSVRGGGGGGGGVRCHSGFIFFAYVVACVPLSLVAVGGNRPKPAPSLCFLDKVIVILL